MMRRTTPGGFGVFLACAALSAGCPRGTGTSETAHPERTAVATVPGTAAAADTAAPSTAAGTAEAPPEPRPPRPFEVAAGTAGDHWPLEARRVAISEGAAVIAKHQCTRCHEIDGLAGAGRPYDCVSCHIFLKGLTPDDKRYVAIAAKNGKDVLDRYIRNIEHLLRVPNLTSVGKRVRPDWIGTFLAEPHDVRPVLEESMIRNKLTDEEIARVVRYFAAVADVPDPTAEGWTAPKLPKKPGPARLAEGKEAFKALGCPSCHTLGNIDFKTGVDADFLIAMKAESLLAPNLRFAADRLNPEIVVDWIGRSEIGAAQLPDAHAGSHAGAGRSHP